MIWNKLHLVNMSQSFISTLIRIYRGEGMLDTSIIILFRTLCDFLPFRTLCDFLPFGILWTSFSLPGASFV